MRRLLFLFTLATMLALPAVAQAVDAPAWRLSSLAAPTNFKPGDAQNDYYQVEATNKGNAVTDGGPIVLTDTLPAGLTVKKIELLRKSKQVVVDLAKSACLSKVVGAVSTVTCTIDESLVGAFQPALVRPSERLTMVIKVSTPKTASGPLLNRVEIDGGAPAASVESENQASASPAAPGLAEFRAELTGRDGQPTSGAASHPFAYTTSFAANTELGPNASVAPLLGAGGDLKDLEFALPPGLIGNPNATDRCTAEQFATIDLVLFESTQRFVSRCPAGSAVGVLALRQLEGEALGPVVGPVYSIVPPPGMPAQFGFQIFGIPFYINTEVRNGSDYGIVASLRNTSEGKRVTAASLTLWGTPTSSLHDSLRAACAEGGGSCPAGVEPVIPFLRLPSSCATPLDTSMSFDNWPSPGVFHSSTWSEAAPTDCDQPPFEPTIEARPTTNVADSPSGLDFDLRVPQPQDPEDVGEADLRDATVTLPEGLLVNPSSADGLRGCSEAEVGFEGEEEGRKTFSGEPPNCPDASKIGSVRVDTPLLDHPLDGAVYLASPHQNPFGSLLALYITFDDSQTGVVVKLPAEVSADPNTGRLTTTVRQTPQLPFEDFELNFFKGARAPLRTSQTCGAEVTTSSLTPWSAPEGSTATPSDTFQIAASPSSGACPTSEGSVPNAPSFEAGTQDPLAGAYSPFLLRLRREDGTQELSGLNVSLPAGLTAKFAGVAECPEALIAQAQARSKPGGGALEQASPSCPASSHLGTVAVGAGAGPSPFYVGGDAYLAGPYKGAPLSMAIITPAVAGPFDLGSVVVRAALDVDPETAKATVESDPIPHILEGIPLDVRSIAVRVDRSQFTLNPTSCEEKSLGAQAISVTGQVAQLANRFQVGGCSNLGFKPKLSLQLKGDTGRGGHPALKATLTYPKAGAYSNIASAQVALPHSEFLDQGNIGTVCTRVQFAAKQCPAKSVYGFARAITPLFDQPLEGPVYLRSSSHQLPDLVADLNGQVEVVLDGRTDSVHGGLRNTFEAVPDAPVTKFTLELKGGKRKGLLENSTNLCRGTNKASASFIAQNGRTLSLRPALEAKCGGSGKKTRHKGHGGA